MDIKPGQYVENKITGEVFKVVAVDPDGVKGWIAVENASGRRSELTIAATAIVK
jgi:hypothetical protein